MLRGASLASSHKQPAKSEIEVDQIVLCLFCEEEFYLPAEENLLFEHFLRLHRFVIADVDLIANLKKYLEFWRIKFKSIPNSLKEFCTTFLIDIEDDLGIEKNVECFLLSDVLEEDKYLRKQLHQERLELALAQQKSEREDTNFKRCCLFCRHEEEGTRADYLKHLSSEHNLQVGRPDNLVYVDRFLDCIEKKIKNLQCIFCERIFKDRGVLREHMRKKGHKRPNPENKFYNQFYLVNYREMGKTWQHETKVCHHHNQNHPHHHNHHNHPHHLHHNHFSSESEDEDNDDDDDGDWSDWQEKEDCNIVCLFCPQKAHSWIGINLHLSAFHKFFYEKVGNQLGFYEQVKLVNYIRRQVLNSQCIICDKKFESNSKLLSHMEEVNHFILPDEKLWNCPEFFFPTLEDDNFLIHIEDNETREEKLEEGLKQCSIQKEKLFQEWETKTK